MAGVALGAGAVGGPVPAWAAAEPGLSAGDVAAARRLFAAGAYTRLGEVLPLLLAAAEHSAEQGPAGAARAAGVWVLASQLAVKQGRTGPAAYAERAGTAARRSGDPVVLAAAARAAATPLRRTGRTDEGPAPARRGAHPPAGRRPAHVRRPGSGGTGSAHRRLHRRPGPPPAPARDFAAQAEETTLRLARHPHTHGRPWELTAGQCDLYGIGIHRHLCDIDTALAHARRLRPDRLPTAERRARAATDTARTLLDAGDTAGAFTQLRLVELAAPLEARRPSVRALTSRVAELRPDLPGLRDYTHRTLVSPRRPA